MPRGQPDFGLYSPESYLAGMSDLAELAVRLGSPVIFDRRGKVICIDDFEGAVLKWEAIESNGATAILDNSYPKSGSQALKLSLADQANSNVTLWKGFSLLPSKRIGIELSISKLYTQGYLKVSLRKFTATSLQIGLVGLDINAGSLWYEDENGDAHYFATDVNFSTQDYYYHYLKLVVDFDLDRYVRFMFSGTEYDLSAYELNDVGVPVRIGIEAQVTFSQRVQAEFSTYLDDFILTMDEP